MQLCCYFSEHESPSYNTYIDGWRENCFKCMYIKLKKLWFFSFLY